MGVYIEDLMVSPGGEVVVTIDDEHLTVPADSSCDEYEPGVFIGVQVVEQRFKTNVLSYSVSAFFDDKHWVGSLRSDVGPENLNVYGLIPIPEINANLEKGTDHFFSWFCSLIMEGIISDFSLKACVVRHDSIVFLSIFGQHNDCESRSFNWSYELVEKKDLPETAFCLPEYLDNKLRVLDATDLG